MRMLKCTRTLICIDPHPGYNCDLFIELFICRFDCTYILTTARSLSILVLTNHCLLALIITGLLVLQS